MTNIKLKNLTPHPINIYSNGQIIKTIPIEKIARVKTEQQDVITLTVEGFKIPVVETMFGEAVGVPDEVEDTYYIVSRLVKSAFPDRKDIIVPLGDIRDENGTIIGTSGFSY